MKSTLPFVAAGLCVLAMGACCCCCSAPGFLNWTTRADSQAGIPVEGSAQSQGNDDGETRSPTPAVMADTFFGGCAYVDANGNGGIDEGDAPIVGATFVVTLQRDMGFSGRTSEDACAMIVIPGGIGEEYWPVTARMQLPEGASLVPVGPAEVVLEYPHIHADFLFAKP